MVHYHRNSLYSGSSVSCSISQAQLYRNKATHTGCYKSGFGKFNVHFYSANANVDGSRNPQDRGHWVNDISELSTFCTCLQATERS